MTTSRRGAIRLMGMAAVASGIPLPSILSAAAIPNNKSNSIQSCFDLQKEVWYIQWPGRISQYDLVYESPPVDPLQGIALGNGEVTALIWCEESKIIIALNKSDLWEDASFGSFGNWNKDQEDISTTLRHAGRFIIDFKYPLFSTLFLTEFSARLSIAEACSGLTASSPFGKINLDFFIEKDSGLLFIDMKTDFEEDSPVEIALERFGSRTYSHWYSQINGDAFIGTSGTSTTADEEGLMITQQLNDLNFTTIVRVLSEMPEGTRYIREHSRRGVIEIPKGRQLNLRIGVAVTSPVADDSRVAAALLLDGVQQLSPDARRDRHIKKWKDVWMRSFLDYGDAYLNHLWHLTMYYSLCCQGGKYPGRFNNGLWAWNRDVQNWNFYFHWNQQQLYWPLQAAGHHDLAVPYLNYRFRSLPQAKADAARLFRSAGAYIADVTERRGFNSTNESHNHTPVAEIALDFWRHYRYTGDKQFLKDKVVPFVTEAAIFYESLLVKEPDGKYHAREGSGYEGWILLRDGLTELVYADVLFRTAINVFKEAGLQHPKLAHWEDIINHLSPLPVVSVPSHVLKRSSGERKLDYGFFKGAAIPSDQVVAAGWDIKENRLLNTYSPHPEGRYFGMKLLDGIFPSVPSAPVFPSGKLSVAKEKEEKFLMDVMRSSMLLYGPGITGWDPVPVVMARLGMKEALQKTLDVFPARWQIYPNGWGHWGVEGEINKDAEMFFRTNKVSDTRFKDREKFSLPMWPFRHMSMESMCVMTAAMNEAVVQSCNGVIVVGAAAHEKQNARCTLHAEGGFMISTEIKSGTVAWIFVKSLWGTQCRIKNPWTRAFGWSEKKKEKIRGEEEMLEITIKKGDGLLLLPVAYETINWEVTEENPFPCQAARFHSSGKVQIGIPKQF
ncbi:MAG: hypothetical protein KF862_26930 [Chitinophagaceae bacterium]|nr:hypothetical protein [Chitinophagaceae bacterium]